MNRDDAEEYTQALGQVVAGGWRQVALGKRLGVPKALDISTDEWVEERLGGYIRLSIPERREAVAELTEEGMSTREIGDVLGVNEATVHRDQHAQDDAVANATPAEPWTPDDGSPQDDAVANATPAEPIGAGQELPTADDLTDGDVRLRRSRARKMLTKAATATSELSSSVEEIAEAVVAQGVDELAAERNRIDRNMSVWHRLLQAVDEQASPQLRRVK